MGNHQSVPSMAEDVEVEEVQKLKKELKKRKKKKKRNGNVTNFLVTAEFFYFYLPAKYNYKYHNYGQRPVSSSYGRGS